MTANAPTQPPANIMLRLSVLMFLQFFIWGAWYLSVSLYMIGHGMGAVRYYAYTAGPLAAIIAPVFCGLIADRFLNTEKVLGVLFLLAGGFMLLLPVVGGMGDPAGFAESAQTIALFGTSVDKGTLFNGLILAHMLCFMPTLGLTASLSFRHLAKGDQQFPLVRLWGTIGWIVAGFILAFGFTETVVNAAGDEVSVEAGTKAIQFYLAGIASVLLGLYCFSLPATPAPKKGAPVRLPDLCFRDAWSQFRNPSFAIFMGCSFLICIPLAAYYASLQQQMMAMGMTHITAWKNVGTFVEAGMMFAMPFFFRKLGVKKMIMIGVGAWVLRYVLFAFGSAETQTAFILVIAGISLHGFCYDFFFVTGQIYVDKSTPTDIRGQAQTMNIFFTQGLGMLLGAMIVGKLASHVFAPVEGNSTLPASLPFWPNLWWPLCIASAVILVIFAVAFHPKEGARDQA
jgi:nucleoside transporter